MTASAMLNPEQAALTALVERGIASLRSAALRGLAAPLFDAVPIVGRWLLPPLGDPDGAPAPVLRVSSRRADAGDLARVVLTEGAGLCGQPGACCPATASPVIGSSST